MQAHCFAHPDAKQGPATTRNCGPLRIFRSREADAQDPTGVLQEAIWIRCGAEPRQAQSGAT